MLPYLWLVSKRAPTQDAANLLVHTHAPDFLRVPEFAGLCLLMVVIILNRFGLFSFRNRAALLAVSFFILPFPLFNQQILSGLSLQPSHYEIYVTNYGLLLGFVLMSGVLFQNSLIRY